MPYMDSFIPFGPPPRRGATVDSLRQQERAMEAAGELAGDQFEHGPVYFGEGGLPPAHLIADRRRAFGSLAPSEGGPFTPQGYTGGPFNMPGRLADGRPAALRSEATEYERARRATPRAYSILGAMLQPDQAALVDAIRRRQFEVMDSTGYSYNNQPGAKSY